MFFPETVRSPTPSADRKMLPYLENSWTLKTKARKIKELNKDPFTAWVRCAHSMLSSHIQNNFRCICLWKTICLQEIPRPLCLRLAQASSRGLDTKRVRRPRLGYSQFLLLSRATRSHNCF